MPTENEDTLELLAAVAAAPADHGRRWVLADYLQEQGDPRGEFLQLQLNIARQQFTAAMRRRADELWQRHARAWFKEVEPYLADFRVEAGFPVEGWLARGLTVEMLQNAFTLPAFTTLTQLHGPSELVAEALRAPRMTALTRVSVRSVRELAIVAERAIPGRITRLDLHMPLSRLAVRRILEVEAFGALESIVVTEPQDYRFANEGESALRQLAKHPSLMSVELAVTELVVIHLPHLWSGTRWRRLVTSIPAGMGDSCDRRCVFERGSDGETTVQLEGLSRSSMRRMRVVMPKSACRVAMFSLRLDKDPTSPEELLREYAGLGPVLY